MKLLRLLPALILGLAAVAAVLAWGARAVEASGTVTTCDDAHLATALSGGGLVTFNCGPATLTITAMKTIAADTTIDGSNNGQPLTITASGVSFPFYVNSGTTLTLTNVTIANVSGTNSGAVYALGALVISGSDFISNDNGSVTAGGALTVTSSLFQANSTAYAIHVTSNGFGHISNSQFISNTNGGIYTQGSLTVSNSQFYSNSIGAAGAGAGLYAYAWSHPQLDLNIVSSQFLTNTAYSGGAVAADGGVVVISNTQLVSNTAHTMGGGLWYETLNPGDGLQVLSATINDNYGGGIAVNGSGGAPLVIANSLIQDNPSTGGTAGVSAGGMAVTVTQSSFINNVTSANAPGGFSAGGPAYITGSLFVNNVGGSAGGLYLGNSGSPLFTDTVANTSILSNTNQGWDGGGIDALVPLILSDSIISGNVTNGSFHAGGGLSWQSPGNNLTISRSLFYNNQAPNSGYGGGLYLQGNAAIVNSTIYNNSASTTGGLHLANSSSLTLTNDTVAGNTGTAGYGNLFGGSSTPIALVNTLLAGGSPHNCAGSILSLGHNLSSDGTCPLTATGDLSGTNPLLGPFQDNGGPSWTLMPTSLSPAVNAGDDANCPATDQRGDARPIGAHCDIGAVETPFKTPQTINFAALADQGLGAPPFGITATASSGLPVSFTSLTTGVCTVSGATVTLVTHGTCTLRASQGGDAIYSAAPNVDRSFNVLQGQTITFNPLAGQTLGAAPFGITATASSGLSVSFSSLTTGVCTVSGTTVTLVGGGTCTLRASQPGNASYAAAPNVDRSFTVRVTQTITFNPLPTRSLMTAPFTVSASATSGLSVSFSSLTPGVCTVSGATVTLVSGGTCTLRASQPGDATHAAAPNVDQSFEVLGVLRFLPLILRS